MANGNFAGGDGSEFNPYLIKDADDLNAIRNDLSGNYKLINDIDLDIYPYNVAEGWIPIGMSFPYFKGIFNGNGFSIKCLYINNLALEDSGLFSTVKGNVINVELSDVNIVSSERIGAICGTNNGIVQNCCSSGVLYGVNYISGLVGRNTNIIKNCYSSCSVEGTGNRVSGFASYSSKKIENCYSTGKVVGLKPQGLIGWNSGSTTINSFWDTESSNAPTSDGKEIGLTTSQMKNSKTFIDVGWDKEVLEDGETPVWVLEYGEYPKLWFEIEKKNLLIKTKDKIKTFEEDALVDTPLIMPVSKEDFDEYGFGDTNFITEDVLFTLEDPKLLIYSEQDNPIIGIEAIPKSQLIKPTDDIRLKMLSKINTMTLTSNKIGEGIVKIIFSVDSGVTWKTYNIETLEFEDIEIIDISNVKAKGIDADTFNTLNIKWNAVVIEGKIRFAYYLEIENEDDVADVDKLAINMDLNGKWKKAVHGADYDYEYDNEHIYVTFNTDGSYKVNYGE